MLRFIAAFAFLFALGGAHAQAATDADWRFFLEHSNGLYRQPEEPVDFEDMLLEAGRGNRNQNAAIGAFAQRLGVSADIAQTYADLIVEAAKHREACGETLAASACAFEPGRPFYDRVARDGVAELTGGLLIVAGKNLNGPVSNEAVLIRRASRHPAAATVFRAIYEYNRDAPYLAALLAIGPPSEETAPALLHALAATSEDFTGWLEALIEVAEQDAANASASVRAELAQMALMRKLKLGLTGEAVTSYLGYPQEIRTLLPVRLTACAATADEACKNRREAAYMLADELAAALWLEGRRQEATALLRAWRDGAGARGFNAAQRYAALSEAIEPRIADADLFALFIEGRRASDPPFQLDARDHGPHGPGWLFAFPEAGPALSAVVAARARGAGYGAMADFLESWDPHLRSDDDTGLTHFAFLFPERVAARQPVWAERIQAAWAHRRARRSEARGSPGVSTAPLAPWWTEKSLPQGVRAWREGDRRGGPPANGNLPVAREAVLRHHTHGGEQFIVYQSSQYDLPGEIPSYGLWFARTEAGAWQPPLYLGLQQHFPYVATPGSALPLLDGDKLRLEVQVREIDVETITFPPVAVDFKRSADGPFLEIDLAALGADRDADGLTDIEEARLGLRFDDPDTDDDGLQDGGDSLPLTRYDPDAPQAATRVAFAILSQLMGHDAGAITVAPGLSADATIEDMLGALGQSSPQQARAASIRTMFVVADPRLFAGVRVPLRLIVYSDADVQALNRGGAPFYPPRVTHVFSSLDGKDHYVIWSAGWTGGEFLARCSGTSARCEVEERGRWIT